MSSPRPAGRLGPLVRSVICAALVLGAAGCGGGDDDDTRTIQSDDGEITVTGDGDGSRGVITGPDGEETEFSAGDGAQLPAGWPDDLQFPEGTDIVAGASMGGGANLTAQALVDGEVSDVYEHFKGLLQDRGYELTTDTLADLGDETMASLNADKDGRSVAVVVMADATEQDRASVSVVVSEEG